MPRPRLQFAIAALLVAAPLTPIPATAAGGDERPACAAAPAIAVTPEVTDALWRLAAGRDVMAPYDAASFVGPPVPLAILYAPPASSIHPGVRIEIEPPLAPAGPPAPAPPADRLTRLDDVRARLVPVQHPDGSVWIDLTGITIVDMRAVIGADGMWLGEGASPRIGGDR